MESESPPQTSPPTATDNTEVLSQRASLGHGEVQEAVKVAAEGNTSIAEERGKSTPMETGDGGNAQFGPQPNIIPETHTAPESGEQPPSKEGGASTPPATSVNPEAPDTLVEALQSATIVEEHRTLMGTVVEKVRSAKSGLNEAYASLQTGFEVRDVMFF